MFKDTEECFLSARAPLKAPHTRAREGSEGGREVGHTGDMDNKKKMLVCILAGDGDADRRMFGLFWLLRSNNKPKGGRRRRRRGGAGSACWSSFLLLLLLQAQEELSADFLGGEAVLAASSSQ